MPSAFISYIREDSEAVARIADVLREFEVTVWLDTTALKPGLRWQDQIRKGISGGDFFLACFSQSYVDRRKTYMNEELTLAIEELRQRPTDRAWFIPIKLTECEIPDRSIGGGETLRSLQWVDLQADWTAGMEKVLSAIVPGSERILRLMEDLGNSSARRRTEAIEALGRLGPLARIAVPKLTARIDEESASPLGLSPLAALRVALKKIGIEDTTVESKITAAFAKWGIAEALAQVTLWNRSTLQTLHLQGTSGKQTKDEPRIQSQCRVIFGYLSSLSFTSKPDPRFVEHLLEWWQTECVGQLDLISTSDKRHFALAMKAATLAHDVRAGRMTKRILWEWVYAIAASTDRAKLKTAQEVIHGILTDPKGEKHFR